MNKRVLARTFAFVGSLLLLLCATQKGQAQTTAFSYQGQLDSGGSPANGSFDMEFSLYDSTGTNLVAGPVTNSATPVTNGVFTVQLDFGSAPFSGPQRWLALGVRTNGSTNAFSALSPMQEILAAPYAVTANSASNVLGSVSASQVTGALSASQLPSSIPASSLTGTISQSQLPSDLLFNNATGLTLAGSFSGSFSGNGSGLTSIPASGLTGALALNQLPSGILVSGETGVSLSGTFNGSFSGNGSGLSGVTASSFSGTVGLGQLPSSVLVNGENFVNLGGSFTGSFSGNGSGLSSINAGNLTGTLPEGVIGPISASSLTTGTVPSAALAGTYPNILVLNNQGNTISGNGVGLTNLTATSLTGVVPLANLPGNVFSIFTNVLSVTTNLSVLATQTVATLEVTNGLLLVTNSPIASVNTDGQGVVIADGSIILTGTISGNGSGLTNASGHSFADVTVTNQLNASLLSAGTTLTNFATTTAQSAVQGFGLNETNFTLGIGTTISNYAQAGNIILSNFVVAGGTLPPNSLITNAILVGPTTNAGSFWLTNGTLGVTNAGLAQGVILRALDGSIAASNVTITGVFTGNGSGLTDGGGSPFGTAISNLALTIGGNSTNLANTIGANVTNLANIIGVNATNFGFGVIAVNATNTALAIGANATNFTLNIGANDTNFAQTIGTTLTNFSSNIGLNDTNFTKSVGVTISNYAQAGNIILSNYVLAGGTLPRSSLVSNAFLVGSTTNEGPFWVTNGNLFVTNTLLGNGVILRSTDGSVTFSGVATGDGAGLTQVNAAELESLTTNNFWLSAGNTGTTPAANFLGTIDQQSFLMKVDSQSALELVPDTTGNLLPVIIGDPAANTVNANAYGSVVTAGTGNNIGSGSYLTAISGGNGNVIGSSAFNSVVAGGNGNGIGNGSYESAIGGGLQNSILTLSSNSFIGGGSLNSVQQNTGFGTIAGGYNNQIQAGAGYSSIGGGYLNAILPNAGYSAIAGGQANNINAGSAQSFIGGGDGNIVNGSASLSVISGGFQNTIGTGSDHSAIVGGQANGIGGTADHAFIGGGINNSVTGADGVVVGGSGNTATASAFAAGTSAQATDAGAFVWADSHGGSLASTNQDTVTFRAQNGYRFFTTSGANAGAFLAGGATSWATISDRNVKKNITPVNPLEVLEKLAQVPVDTWNYKWEGDKTPAHIGPMAQDFKHTFYPGTDDKSITTLEFDGVELAAIKGLNTKVDEQDATVKKQISEQAEQLKTKDAEIQSLKDRLERLEKLLNVDKQ